MAKNKESVTEIMRTVPHAKALEIQAELDKWVRFQLAEATGENKSGNSAQVKAKGRPKKSKSEGSKQDRHDDNGAPADSGSVQPVGNPEGRRDKSRREKRIKEVWCWVWSNDPSAYQRENVVAYNT
ncbi:unnamed protein product [Ectocarpus sp. CCAP 1310/34]|nr:unnamed protein product [Ectocarpus sp. CCAP 1310/34]